MAKKSVVLRNNKRKQISQRMREARETLKRIIKKEADNRETAVIKLQKRPRDESGCRVRHRCRSCGRPRGNLRKFGLCRICLRQAAMRGEVPGLRKSSW